MAECTADGKYKYYIPIISTRSLNKTLYDHSIGMNDHIERINRWVDAKHHKHAPGQWGVDINISRIGHALETTNYKSSIDEIAAAVHDGWRACYSYWYTHKPWKSANGNSSLYVAPGKSLNSRNKLARSNLKYDELDEHQKMICRQMAMYIRYNCM